MPLLATRDELQCPPRLGKLEANDEIWRWPVFGSLFGPLDQANRIVTEVLAKPCIQELFWKVETIEIKVIPVYPRNHINFNQCVGRAFDRPGMAACAQQRTNEGGLARAEVAVEPDDHARRQRRGQVATQSAGRRFVRQVQGE